MKKNRNNQKKKDYKIKKYYKKWEKEDSEFVTQAIAMKRKQLI